MPEIDEVALTTQKAGRGGITDDMSAGRQILCLTVAVVLVGILAIIAVILSAIALNQPAQIMTSVQVPGGTGGTSDADKVWVFAIGHDNTNLEYIDDLTGTVRGFHVDMVEAVCKMANKNCRLMWDIYDNCYMSKAGERPRPGEGLVDRWYDGCVGWFNTYERSASVSFTKPFRRPLNAVFFVKQGNPRAFDSSDLTGKKIGFVDGHAANEFCIQRSDITGGNLPASQIVHYSTRDEVIAGVNGEEVDAIFANDQIFNLKNDLEVAAGDPITTCMIDGAGMMLRKDSLVPSWWDPAFDQLKQTSEYRRICSEVTERHDQSDHEVDCVA